MKKASDYRRIARDTLQGKWYAAGAVCLVAALLGAVPAGGGNRVTLSLETMKSWLNEYPVFWAVILFFLVYWILVTVISGAVTMGHCIFHLRLLEGKETVFADLFSQLHRVKTGFILVLRASVSVFLWMLLFFIPGLIKSISYVMAPYILAENPGMRAKDALKKSVELMKGNKWKTFVLDLSFIGWFILSIITFGIVYFFYVNPYYLATDAELYLKLKETNTVVTEN